MSTQNIPINTALINEYLDKLCNYNGYWLSRISTLCAILTLNQDWDLDGDELDELSGHMVDDGFPPASNEEMTRALWERGFEVQFYDSHLIGDLISEIGVDAEDVIDAARRIGVDEDVLKEVKEKHFI